MVRSRQVSVLCLSVSQRTGLCRTWGTLLEVLVAPLHFSDGGSYKLLFLTYFVSPKYQIVRNSDRQFCFITMTQWSLSFSPSLSSTFSFFLYYFSFFLSVFLAFFLSFILFFTWLLSICILEYILQLILLQFKSKSLTWTGIYLDSLYIAFLYIEPFF